MRRDLPLSTQKTGTRYSMRTDSTPAKIADTWRDEKEPTDREGRLSRARREGHEVCPQCGWSEGLCWCPPPRPKQCIPTG